MTRPVLKGDEHLCLVPPKEITAGPVCLKAAAREHAGELFRTYTGDVEAARFLTRKAHPDVKTTLRVIEAWGAPTWGDDDRFAWTMVDDASGSPAGLLFLRTTATCGEIHFGVARSFRGQGVAGAACQALLRWIDAETEIRVLATTCHPENVASRRLLERLGFRLRPRVEPERHDDGSMATFDQYVRSRRDGVSGLPSASAMPS